MHTLVLREVVHAILHFLTQSRNTSNEWPKEVFFFSDILKTKKFWDPADMLWDYHALPCRHALGLPRPSPDFYIIVCVGDCYERSEEYFVLPF